ncbi:hypothetical protein JRQ81_012664 [Phrynocephalus forsythii]|uniref:TAFH domain-containing protein n=1 Tax=Phrynocephalus forsythii TaxID=171643 RepID=A0A9Q0Y3M4_9SAUR|nr:hypothetical protein JRQ81_012664 [Phrynocephalus forsythii]
MSTPVTAAAQGRCLRPGPPERAASAMGPPANGAGGLQGAPAVLRAGSTAPPASCPATPAGKPAAALLPAGARIPLRLAPATCPQPQGGSSSVETWVAKGAPVHPLPKVSGTDPRLPSCQAVASKGPPATATIQLPAHFQIPQGAVLFRSNTGQLILVSQQALVQTQNQIPNNTSIRWSVPANSPAVKIQTPQNSGTPVLKVLAAPVKIVSQTTPSVTSTVKKSAASTDSNSTIVIAKSLIAGSSAKPPASDSSALSLAPKPLPEAETVTGAQSRSSAEMLENVKKCKNFLATLIKLASSGPQASEMGQNVKNLVQRLLEAKIEPEEFTKELYIELKSSPQPYLVPFLKKSLVALRQLMPNPQLFIQQCLHQPVPKTAPPPSCTPASSTASTVTDSSPVITTTIQTVRPVPRINPGRMTSSQAPCPSSCTSLVTRGSAPLQLAQTTHGLAVGTVSLQGTSLASSTQLATAIHTAKALQPASSSSSSTTTTTTTSTTVQTTGNTSLQLVKPVSVPAVSSAALAALSSVKSVSLPLMATTVQTVKSPLKTAATTSATVGSISVPSGTSVAGKPIVIRVAHPTSILSQSVQTSQAVKVKQLIVRKPSETILRKVASVQQASVCPSVDKSDSLVKQITLPGNKILSLKASPVQRKKIRENGTTSFRDEDDINDVTSMAGVNLSEESACILRTNSETVGPIIQSCPEELLLSSDALQKKILEIGKRHDIMEVNSDVLNLISHATQERLRGLLEKLTVIAQHRLMAYKGNDKYIISSDTRAQLRFLEQLDHVEKQRRDDEEREMLLRAAKSRSNKEDPEQLRLKQKAKEMQQLEFAQMQQREANRAALAAIGPRRKRPLGSLSLSPGLEVLNGLPNLAKPCLRPRIIRLCLRDLIFCMEQERELKHSLALYQALLK